jgi:hypothetical protein
MADELHRVRAGELPSDLIDVGLDAPDRRGECGRGEKDAHAVGRGRWR